MVIEYGFAPDASIVGGDCTEYRQTPDGPKLFYKKGYYTATTTSCEPFRDEEIEPMQRVKPNRAERRRKQKIRQRTEWD